MKNASQIINLIQSKPQFSKLNSSVCIKKIQSLFIPEVQKMIKFAYFKNNILFFVFLHPAGKQEFDNSIQTIKSALNFVNPIECNGILIKDIKSFVTHTPINTINNEEVEVILYDERANGDFEITVKDEKLRAIMQEIKEIIKKGEHK